MKVCCDYRVIYYTEKDGKTKYVDSNDITNAEDVKAEYLISIRSTFSREELRINVPEEMSGCSVEKVTIIHSTVSSIHDTGLEYPTIKHLYLPSGVKELSAEPAILKSYNPLMLKPTEKCAPLNGCAVEISPDNPYLCVCGNGIYSRDMTELYYIFSPDELFEVPSGVKRIKKNAGSFLKGLHKLVIPETVIEIEDGAFEHCADLEYADISAGKLGRRAFYGCAMLGSLRLDCKKLGDEAFSGCGRLENVELVDTAAIGGETFFLSGRPIKELKLPDNPDYCIYKNAVYTKDMTELIYIFSPGEYFEVPSGVSIIKRGAGRALRGLCRLVIPKGVLFIEEGAFEYCRDLTEADIHSSAVGKGAFKGCEMLTAVRLDSKLIDVCAFVNCRSLKSVELVNTEIIARSAFNLCNSLDMLKLPDTLLRIEKNAFFGTEIKHLTIPPSVFDIGDEILKNGDPKSITLEVYLKDGGLPLRNKAPVPNGALLVVRSPETDEVLFEFVILGSLDTIFTKNGVDFTEYDSIFRNDDPHRFTPQKKILAALARLRYPIGMDEEKIAFFKDYVSENAALMLITAIKKPDTAASGILEYQFFDLINENGLLTVIEEAAKAGKTEITAVLMQKLHERKNNE